MKPKKYLTQVGIFPQNGERVFQGVTADCCPVSPWKLGWGGGERRFRTEAVAVCACASLMLYGRNSATWWSKYPPAKNAFLKIKNKIKNNVW